MEQGVIPCIFYLYIFEKIKEKSRDGTIPKKDVLGYMGTYWKIPKKLKPLIIKELEVLGLIENLDYYNLKLNKSDFCEESINKFYDKMGLFTTS